MGHPGLEEADEAFGSVVPGLDLNERGFDGKGSFGAPEKRKDGFKGVLDEYLIDFNPKDSSAMNFGLSDESAPTDVALPVIDMAPLLDRAADLEGAKRVIEEMGKACEEWGYFQAINHGVPESLLEQLPEAAEEFFQFQREAEDLHALKPGRKEGYQRLCSTLARRLWSNLRRQSVRGARPDVEVDRVDIPAKGAQYIELIKKYTPQIDKLLQVVWTSLTVYLDLQTTALQKPAVGEDRTTLKINCYRRSLKPKKAVGDVAHDDCAWMTVLLEDQLGGLQVAKPDVGDDVWLDVKPLKGSLLINIGKHVEHLTDGRFKAMVHRDLVTRNEKSTSISAFAIPGPECIVSRRWRIRVQNIKSQEI